MARAALRERISNDAATLVYLYLAMSCGLVGLLGDHEIEMAVYCTRGAHAKVYFPALRISGHNSSPEDITRYLFWLALPLTDSGIPAFDSTTIVHCEASVGEVWAWLDEDDQTIVERLISCPSQVRRSRRLVESRRRFLPDMFAELRETLYVHAAFARLPARRSLSFLPSQRPSSPPLLRAWRSSAPRPLPPSLLPPFLPPRAMPPPRQRRPLLRKPLPPLLAALVTLSAAPPVSASPSDVFREVFWLVQMSGAPMQSNANTVAQK